MQDQTYSGVENLEIMREAESYNRYLLSLVKKYAPAEGTVLDFGAGNGDFALPLSALGFDVVAVEPDDSLRSNLQRNGLRATAAPDELADQSFQYIYTLNVLEHIPDDVQALRQLRSRLVANGTLLIYVPAFPILYTSMDRKVGHVRRYTRRTLASAVTQAGLTIERVVYVDSLGLFATLLFKAMDNDHGNVNPHALRLYDRLVFPLSKTIDLITGRWFGKNLLLIARNKTDISGQGST